MTFLWSPITKSLQTNSQNIIFKLITEYVSSQMLNSGKIQDVDRIQCFKTLNAVNTFWVWKSKIVEKMKLFNTNSLLLSIYLSFGYLLLSSSAIDTTTELVNSTKTVSRPPFHLNTSDISKLLEQSLFSIISAPKAECEPGYQLDHRMKCRKFA